MIKMVKWYFEKKELRTTPSVIQGLALETEQRYRREGARFIIDLGSTMNLSLTTMATGVVYFHRFYMFHTFQDFARYPTACACLFLAGKVEETPKKCKDIVKFARDVLPDNKFLQFGPEARNWTDLLQTIKFDLQVEHPYTFLLKYAKCVKGDKNRLQKMVQMAWTFVNDSLCTTLCLQWEPEIIAIALMYLAGKLSKFEVVDWNGRRSEHLRWWDMFVEDMTSPPDSPPPPQMGIPPINSLSNQVSPLANPTTPQAGSKTSTPVQALTPTLPPVTGQPTGSGVTGASYHPPPSGYSYPPNVIPIPGMPPYNQPPPPTGPPPSMQAGAYVGGQAYYPPPPLPGRPYQPPPPK
ncbi:Cyclin-K [Orchesella cincta]|uniref:Cyclin-K n=1 Tax=Orchesella cincta TaxID=48709 RepID=A0A1D2N7C3_ORCCI|nr:Cyclin-K [Orchesella cincta]